MSVIQYWCCGFCIVYETKKGIHEKVWYPEWNDKERWAAQQALNNALDILQEFEY